MKIRKKIFFFLFLHCKVWALLLVSVSYISPCRLTFSFPSCYNLILHFGICFLPLVIFLHYYVLLFYLFFFQFLISRFLHSLFLFSIEQSLTLLKNLFSEDTILFRSHCVDTQVSFPYSQYFFNIYVTSKTYIASYVFKICYLF